MYQIGLRRLNRRAAPLCVAFAVAALALGGCAPFPMHLDPLSVNGRDGSGPPTPTYGALMRLGAAAEKGGDYANALSVYRRAATLNPHNPKPFLAIGDALLHLGNVNQAIVAYQSALARDPHNLAATMGVAKAYLRTGRPELALVPLGNGLRYHPGNVKLLVLLGVTKDVVGRHWQAQEAYRLALKHAPKDQAATVNLALSLALSGSYHAAIETLEPLALAPAGTPSERQTLALIYGLNGNDRQAARLGRIDLDAAAVAHNLAYYAALRNLSPEARSRAILSSIGSAGSAKAS